MMQADVNRCQVRPVGGPAGKSYARRPFIKVDQCIALAVFPFVAMLIVGIAPILLVAQGRPIFHRSLRVGAHGRQFWMWKLRTMRPSRSVEVVLGNDLENRVTPFGRWLRQSRIDELPQIINILSGDLVFIGVRAPFPRHVERAPEVFRELLDRPPGVTGLGTLFLCKREERWLADAKTTEEIEEIYVQTCLRRKLRIDRFFLQNKSFGLVVLVLVLTLFRGQRVERTLNRVRRMPLFRKRQRGELHSAGSDR